MIDIGKETPIPLSDFGRLLPSRTASNTVSEWVNEGRWNASRSRKVKLECIKLPAGKCTTMEAYRRFVDQLNKD